MNNDWMSKRYLVAFLVAATFFMENLDMTIMTTALPAMGESFNVNPASLSIGIAAYMVAVTVFIPISGWLTDRFGPRLIFSMAIVLFTIASLFCGMSQNIIEFTLARVLQGVGGAMMVPVGRIVVLRETPKSQMINMIAILTWPGLIAPIIAPALGGWITSQISWHWIFYINLPLGILALIAAVKLIDAPKQKVGKFDVVGFILSGMGITLLMLGIEFVISEFFNVWYGIAVFSLGVILLIASIIYLQEARHPLLSLSVLKTKTFRLTVFSGSFFRISVNSAPFLLPLMFQLSFSWTPVEAGTMLLWLFIGNLVIKPMTTFLLNYFGFKNILLFNGLLVSVGFFCCAFLSSDTSKTLITLLMFILGMTRSLQFTAYMSIGFADISQDKMRDANTLFSVVQQMNSGLGISLGALAISIGIFVENYLPNFVFTQYQWAFCVVGLFALLASWEVLKLNPEDGVSVLKKSHRSLNP